MRYIIFASLVLSGCVTSLGDIREREVQDNIVTAQSLPAVRDCILEKLAMLRTPTVLGNDQRAEIIFSSPQAGAIFDYILTAEQGGTRVEARRKNNIADGFNAARRCYGGPIDPK